MNIIIHNPLVISCENSCVVSSKIHGTHFKQEAVEMRNQLKEVFAYPGTRVVVIERQDVDALYCSLRYSQVTGNWHGSRNETEYKLWKLEHCSADDGQKFKEDHHEWFTWVYKTLKN